MWNIPDADLIVAARLDALASEIETGPGYSVAEGRTDHRAEAVSILRTMIYALCASQMGKMTLAVRSFLDSVDPERH